MLWVRFWPLEVDSPEVQFNELNSVIELRSFRRSCQDLFQIVLLFRFQSWSDQIHHPSDSKINKKWTWLEPLINRTSSPVAMIFFGELIVSYSSKFSFLLFIQGSIHWTPDANATLSSCLLSPDLIYRFDFLFHELLIDKCNKMWAQPTRW